MCASQDIKCAVLKFMNYMQRNYRFILNKLNRNNHII
jgi:hypothetical protein